jgi:hypothetical protein
MCLAVVTVAKITTTQKTPVSAERMKRGSIAHSNFKHPAVPGLRDRTNQRYVPTSARLPAAKIAAIRNPKGTPTNSPIMIPPVIIGAASELHLA